MPHPAAFPSENMLRPAGIKTAPGIKVRRHRSSTGADKTSQEKERPALLQGVANPDSQFRLALRPQLAEPLRQLLSSEFSLP